MQFTLVISNTIRIAVKCHGHRVQIREKERAGGGEGKKDWTKVLWGEVVPVASAAAPTSLPGTNKNLRPQG